MESAEVGLRRADLLSPSGMLRGDPPGSIAQGTEPAGAGSVCVLGAAEG